jgi:type III pantothenate kinase
MSRTTTVLAIDVGNTRAKFGLFDVRSPGDIQPREIVARVLSETEDLSAALKSWLSNHHVKLAEHVMIAGSQPEIRDSLIHRWPLSGCQPHVIDGYQQIPVHADVESPHRVGIDRLLNIFAAGRLLSERRPAIVVDSGTATTVDLMTSDYAFRGGSILPGLRLSAYAMHDYTARLPLLNVDENLTSLPELPGRNTEDAMKAGLFIGQLGAVRELIHRLAQAATERFRETVPPQVYVTGGGGRQLVDYLSDTIYVDSLPLHGLARLSQAAT